MLRLIPNTSLAPPIFVMYKSKTQLDPGAHEGSLKGSRNDGILSGVTSSCRFIVLIRIDEFYLLTQIELDTYLGFAEL